MQQGFPAPQAGSRAEGWQKAKMICAWETPLIHSLFGQILIHPKFRQDFSRSRLFLVWAPKPDACSSCGVCPQISTGFFHHGSGLGENDMVIPQLNINHQDSSQHRLKKSCRFPISHIICSAKQSELSLGLGSAFFERSH